MLGNIDLVKDRRRVGVVWGRGKEIVEDMGNVGLGHIGKERDIYNHKELAEFLKSEVLFLVAYIHL